MSANQSNRELRLKLKFESDARGASQAFKDMASHAEKIDKHMSQAARSAQQGARGSLGSSAAGSSGGGSGGSAVASILGGATVAAVASGVLGIANAVGKLREESVSASEKLKALTEAVPIFGGALTSMLGEIQGVAQQFRDRSEDRSLRKSIADFPVGLARQDATMSYGSRRDALMRQGRSLGFAADAARQFPTIASQRAGRPDDRDPRIAAAEEAVQAARRAASIASSEVTAAAGDEQTAIAARDRSSIVQSRFAPGSPEQKRREDALRRQREDNRRFEEERARYERLDANVLRRTLRGAAGGIDDLLSFAGNARLPGGRRLGLTGSGISLQKMYEGGSDLLNKADEEPVRQLRASQALLDNEKKIAEAQQLSKNATEATTRLQERQADLARKQYELSKAEPEVSKARLAILEDQEKSLRGQSALARQSAEQFGMFDPIKQKETLEALKMFQKGGRNSLSADQFDLLQGSGLTGDFVKDKLGQQVSTTDAYKQILTITGQKDAAALDAQVKKVAAEKMAVKTEVDLKVQLDEESLAKTFRDQFQKLLMTALRNIAAEENMKTILAENRKAAGNAQR